MAYNICVNNLAKVSQFWTGAFGLIINKIFVRNVLLECFCPLLVKKDKKKPYIVGENQRYDCLTKEPTHNNNLKIDITPPQKSTHNVNILFPYLLNFFQIRTGPHSTPVGLTQIAHRSNLIHLANIGVRDVTIQQFRFTTQFRFRQRVRIQFKFNSSRCSLYQNSIRDLIQPSIFHLKFSSQFNSAL